MEGVCLKWDDDRGRLQVGRNLESCQSEVEASRVCKQKVNSTSHDALEAAKVATAPRGQKQRRTRGTATDIELKADERSGTLTLLKALLCVAEIVADTGRRTQDERTIDSITEVRRTRMRTGPSTRREGQYLVVRVVQAHCAGLLMPRGRLQSPVSSLQVFENGRIPAPATCSYRHRQRLGVRTWIWKAV